MPTHVLHPSGFRTPGRSIIQKLLALLGRLGTRPAPRTHAPAAPARDDERRLPWSTKNHALLFAAIWFIVPFVSLFLFEYLRRH